MNAWWVFPGAVLVVFVTALLVLRWLGQRKPRPDQAPTARPTIDLPHVAPPILHLVVEPEHRTLCGASIREAWTIEPEAATCPECRREGDAAMIQWLTNNR